MLVTQQDLPWSDLLEESDFFSFNPHTKFLIGELSTPTFHPVSKPDKVELREVCRYLLVDTPQFLQAVIRLGSFPLVNALHDIVCITEVIRHAIAWGHAHLLSLDPVPRAMYLVTAAKYGRIQMLKDLRHCPLQAETIITAAIAQDTDFLSTLLEESNRWQFDIDAVEEIISHGNSEKVIIWWLDHKLPVSQFALSLAVKTNEQHLVKLLMGTGLHVDREAIEESARKGDLTALQSFHEMGSKFSNSTISCAIEADSVSCLTFLRNKCELSCSYHAMLMLATTHGALGVLTELLNTTEPLSSDDLKLVRTLLTVSCEMGHMHLVRWLLERHPYAYHPDLSYIASFYGFLGLVRFFRPWGFHEEIAHAAAAGGALHVLKELPVSLFSETTVHLSMQNDNFDCVAFCLEVNNMTTP